MIGRDVAELWTLLGRLKETEEWAYATSGEDRDLYSEKMFRYYRDVGELVRRIYNELKLS